MTFMGASEKKKPVTYISYFCSVHIYNVWFNIDYVKEPNIFFSDLLA